MKHNTQVIDALVDHFMTFTTETRLLPVLWHQSLLVFAQRYREDVTRLDKDRLKEVRPKCNEVIVVISQDFTCIIVLRIFIYLLNCEPQQTGVFPSDPRAQRFLAELW